MVGGMSDFFPVSLGAENSIRFRMKLVKHEKESQSSPITLGVVGVVESGNRV